MMMTIQMQTYQMMTRGLFAFKQYALMQIEDMLIQLDNVDLSLQLSKGNARFQLKEQKKYEMSTV